MVFDLFFQASFAVLERPPRSTAKVARLGFIARQHSTLLAFRRTLHAAGCLLGTLQLSHLATSRSNEVSFSSSP